MPLRRRAARPQRQILALQLLDLPHGIIPFPSHWACDSTNRAGSTPRPCAPTATPNAAPFACTVSIACTASIDKDMDRVGRLPPCAPSRRGRRRPRHLLHLPVALGHGGGLVAQGAEGQGVAAGLAAHQRQRLGERRGGGGVWRRIIEEAVSMVGKKKNMLFAQNLLNKQLKRFC
mmetsp:Transcript_15231/g.24787  ORF Transcript_15231/g.24787 Transcript_15231/m.24787 type:complete len:175 (+) Transcript_15231:936-1460(+)